ncbi:hypothetical protein BO71DRAFT_356377 [Aspergillus ellipticus CBS 707.79]|uniref:Peroxisomal biogenesis factor 11 n=1 Tax=Aspergillus ellipticus CBS 707.79 TaxID=1448320 RepID=A0A319DNQ1_9EURO|nr:hypothetical protein BO71DRAFT_356377 [Aspergillus ellipticus CBS 707.79]
MLSHLLRFTRTTPGLEKTFRLLQAACVLYLQLGVHSGVLGGGLGEDGWVKRAGVARGQLGLTRRFLRCVNFLDCFNRSFALLGGAGNQAQGGLATVLEICKWGCLGVYFLLEDVILLHQTSIYPLPAPLSKTIPTEANKFWFYALGFSLLGAAWTVLFSGGSSSSTSASGAAGKSPQKSNKSSASTSPVVKSSVDTRAILKKALVDGCDILIPGTFLGWIDVSELGVGVGMVVSTLVSGWEIWKTV